MRHPGKHALAFIFLTVLIDTIGFGIILPVLPQLIVELTTLRQALLRQSDAYRNELGELLESMHRALDAISLGTGEPAYFNGTGQMPHDIVVAVHGKFGQIGFLRPNHRQPPFDRPEARRALALLTDQADYMAVTAGADGRYWSRCYSFLACGGANENQAATDWMRSVRAEEAKRLFREAGYAGEPIVIIAPGDNEIIRGFGTLAAAVHTMTLAILGSLALAGRLRWQARPLVRYAVITVLATVVILGGMRLLFATVLHREFEGADIVYSMQPRFGGGAAAIEPADAAVASGSSSDLLAAIRQRGVLRVGAPGEDIWELFAARRTWRDPPLSSEPFWRDPRLVHGFPVDARFLRVANLLYQGPDGSPRQFVRGERYHAVELFDGVFQTGRWPVGIYPGWLRYSVTFLVPIAFAVTVPAQAVTSRLEWQTLALAGARRFHPGAHGGARLPRLGPREVLPLHRGHREVDVDPVQQRPRDPRQVLVHVVAPAAAGAVRVECCKRHASANGSGSAGVKVARRRIKATHVPPVKAFVDCSPGRIKVVTSRASGAPGGSNKPRRTQLRVRIWKRDVAGAEHGALTLCSSAALILGSWQAKQGWHVMC